MRNAVRILNGIVASPFQLAVWLYQRTLSPDHGPLKHLFPYGVCRHTPTCSDYAIKTLYERSLPIALFLIMKRVLSCTPLTRTSEKRLQEVIARELT